MYERGKPEGRARYMTAGSIVLNGRQGSAGGSIFVRKILFGVCFGLFALPAPADEVKTDYMAIYHGQAKVGYSQATRSVHGREVCYDIIVEMLYSGGTRGSKIQTNETIDGKPLSLSQQNLDGSGRIDVTFNNGKMEVSRGPGSVVQTKQTPIGAVLSEGDLLLMKSKGLKEGTSYSFSSIDTFTARPQTVTVRVGPVKDVKVLDRIEKLHEVMRQDGDIRSVNYMDDDYNVRKSIVTVMEGRELELVGCDKDLALGPNCPLDIRISSTLELPSDISGYRDAAAMEIVLVPDGKTSIDIPSTAAQSVSRRPDGSFVVTVRAQQAPVGGTFPYRGNDAELLAALSASSDYECADPQIVEMAHMAAGGRNDADQACLAVQLFVRTWIYNKVESSDNRATAILKNRTGKCRQHAILMVALCRALGIPAREVVGLASDGQNRLSGHAWVQCHVGGRWVDYDAALDGFDVSHVAFWAGANDVDYSGLLNKFGHLKAVHVKLKRPWYRHLGWPMSITAAVGVCLFLRWRKRRSPGLPQSTPV